MSNFERMRGELIGKLDAANAILAQATKMADTFQAQTDGGDKEIVANAIYYKIARAKDEINKLIGRLEVMEEKK